MIIQHFRNVKPSRLIYVCIVIFLVIAVPTFAVLDSQSADEKAENISSTEINPLRPAPSNFNGLFITANITSVDIPNNSFKATFSLRPLGSFALNGNDPIFKRPNTTIGVVFGSNLVEFREALPMATQTQTLTFRYGNINRYPFDVFLTDFILYAATSPRTDQPLVEVPIALSVVGAIQSWRTVAEIRTERSLNSQFIRISFEASRSFTTKFFSMVFITN